MPITSTSLLRLVAAPSLESVTAAAQGFPRADAAVREHLDRIPQAVVLGFEWAMDARGLADLEQRIRLMDEAHQGFAYEGAAMAYTILDAPRRGHRTQELLAGPALPHLFLAYIGIGFAMTRLPRPLWHRVLPDLDAPPYHPAMSWLVIDGLGFDLAYFHAQRWLRPEASRQPRPWPWLGDRAYFRRAVDQGFGRALWFVAGANADAAGATISQFPVGRQGDLWSGVGLAAAFAGPDSSLASRVTRVVPAEFAAHVACGATLAAAARVRGGYVPDHTQGAVTALTGWTPDEASTVADRCAPSASVSGPIYEQWRANIRDAWSRPEGMNLLASPATAHPLATTGPT